jgi:DNA-binding CsgD family transcriptional regulator
MDSKNQLPDYTKQQLTKTPVDLSSEQYQEFKRVIKRFPEEAVYIYSFKENRLIYADGWEETLGYKDTEIDLLTIMSKTDPLHAPFAFDLNDKAVQFILSKKQDMLQYSYSFEARKIHKNETLIPMQIKLSIFSVEEDGTVKEAIGRFQVNRDLRFGKVIRYAAYGPDKNEFEDELNKSLFEHIAISNKEKVVLHYVSKGLTIKEIASKLDLSKSGVEKRILPLYKRFNVNSLPHLISFSYENFILP